MGATERLAKFVCGVDYRDFDAETIEYTKGICLSTLGMAAAGSVLKPGKIVIAYTKDRRAPEEAGVIGAGLRTSMEYAALANGHLAHTTELEDVGFPEAVFPISIVPASFALAEKYRSSGRDVLSSIIVGHEVQARLGLVTMRDSAAQRRGWHNAGVLGAVGAAAAAAKLMNLDVQHTRMALAVAASMGSGLHRQTGAMSHLLEAGLAARNGVAAATLAKYGLTGGPDILEGERGLVDAVSGQQEVPLDGLGKPYMILNVGFKKYPCCYCGQRANDGVLALIREHSISYDNVREVELEVNSTAHEIMQHDFPGDGEHARFSLPHGVAAAFFDGDIFTESYTDAKTQDPRFQEAWRKVRVTVHPEWPAGPSAGVTIVSIRLKDGREYKKSVAAARGDAGNKLTTGEMMEKYTKCARYAFPKEQAERAAQLIMALDDQRVDVAELMSLLTFPKHC